MPKGDKYVGLASYLQNRGEKHIVLSFSEIESQIGDRLPESANKHRAFWSNTRTHSVAFGWLDAGYKTTNVDFKGKLISFEKVD